MRLDFNVLWVDDQPARVAAQIKAITKRMEEEGFQFNSTACMSMEQVISLVSDDVFADQVDLILVDWDLGGGLQGQDVIAAIRTRVLYKDIVFYSAHTEASELRRLAFERNTEGVYCASRHELVEEVIGVFESLVKKVLDLDHARGIVMGATSDIDYMVNECLRAIHAMCDQAGREAMLKEVLDFIEQKIDHLTQSATRLRKEASLAACLEEYLLFTANDRLRLLSRALKRKELAAHKAYRPSVVQYLEKVVPKRNIYAHLVLVPDGRPQTLTGLEGTVITIQETRDLRKVILTLRGDFRRLKLALCPATSSG